MCRPTCTPRCSSTQAPTAHEDNPHDAPLEGERAPYPALGLVVSGGHTAIYRMRRPAHAHRLGSTIDDAVGEVYDKVATILGLEYPGGPRVDALAAQPDADDRARISRSAGSTRTRSISRSAG
jgi:tRNA A37 threonylcarbamoyltransferase TsaD